MQQANLNSLWPSWKNSLNEAAARGLRILYSPEPKTLSEWADEHFYLSPESSSTAGEWETIPYQKGIMDCMSNDDIKKITWRKSARTGYTKIIVAAICYFSEHKRRGQVIFQPTNGDAEEFTKDELDPAFRDVDCMSEIFPEHEKKSKKNTLAKKMMKGSTLDIRGGESPGNYRRLTKDIVYYDELSGFPHNVGGSTKGDGGATDLGDIRLTSSSFPKSVRGSTPKLSRTCLISASLDEADIVLNYCVPCPHCN